MRATAINRTVREAERSQETGRADQIKSGEIEFRAEKDQECVLTEKQGNWCLWLLEKEKYFF